MIAVAMTPWHQTNAGDGLQQLQTEDGAGDHRRDRRRYGPVPTAAHLAAWAGVAPAMHESAGKRRPAGSRKVKSGWRRCWSRPPARCPGRRPPTWPRSTPRSRPGAGASGPLSPSRTRFAGQHVVGDTFTGQCGPWG
jgi:hypothetical protein